jgi:hypothetical protein
VATLTLGSAANMVSFRRSLVLVWVGLALVLLVDAVRPKQKSGQHRTIAALLLAGVIAGSAAAFPHARAGWTSRAEVNAGDITTGRDALLPQMARVLGTAPVFGVGPGNYLPALIRLEPELKKPTMVHVAPLLLVAEAGWTMAFALVLALGAFGAWLVRIRRLFLARHIRDFALAALPFVAMCLLTPLPTLYAIGPLLTALHLAMIAVFAPSAPATQARVADRAVPSSDH